MVVWTSDPGLFSVQYPSVVYRDFTQNLTITVRDSATHIGLADVIVTLSKGDEVYSRSFTDATGRAYIAIRPDTEGLLELEAVKPNFTNFKASIIVDTYCEPAVPGDANGDGAANGVDAIFMTNYFKGGANPPDSCMCTGENFLYHAADANGNCNFNGVDIIYLNNYLKSTGPAPFFCPTCPINRLLREEAPISVRPARKIESE